MCRFSLGLSFPLAVTANVQVLRLRLASESALVGHGFAFTGKTNVPPRPIFEGCEDGVGHAFLNKVVLVIGQLVEEGIVQLLGVALGVLQQDHRHAPAKVDDSTTRQPPCLRIIDTGNLGYQIVGMF